MISPSHLLARSRIVELYLHSPICFNGVKSDDCALTFTLHGTVLTLYDSNDSDNLTYNRHTTLENKF